MSNPLSTDPAATPSGSVPWIYAGTVALALGGGLFYLYLARTASSAEVGTISLLAAIATVVVGFTSLGLGNGFQHYLAYYRGKGDAIRARRLARLALGVALLLAGAAIVLLVGFAAEWSRLFFHTASYAALLDLLAIFAGLSMAVGVLQSLLAGLQRFMALSAITMAQTIVMYGGTVGLLRAFPGTPVTVVVGWSLGMAVSASLCLGVVLRQTASLERSPARGRPPTGIGRMFPELFRYSLPAYVAGLLGTGAFYVDRLILAAFVDLSAVGIYTYAILAASAAAYLVNPFGTVLVPRLSALFGRDDAEGIRSVVGVSIALVVLVYVPAALLLSAVAPVALGLFVGPAYVSASEPLRILLLATAAAIPYTVLGSLAFGIRRTPLVMYASALALLSNIALSVVLIPRFSFTGAAIGNSAMAWVPLVVLYFGLRGTGLIRIAWRPLLSIWTASVAMAATIGVILAVPGAGPLGAVAGVAVGLALFLVLLRWTRGVTTEMVDTILISAPRWKYVVGPLLRWLTP